MEDIRRANKRLWIRELLDAGRIFGSAFGIVIFGLILSFYGPPFGLKVFCGLMIALIVYNHVRNAHERSIGKRFHNRRFDGLWKACEDRLARFEEVLGKMRRDQIADFQEMPNTIRKVGDNLYVALRRADIISHEVYETERGIYTQPAAWNAATSDDQANHLYQIADRNIAEYRQHFAGVMAGVQRAEAQAAVYMTTLDTLRMKMIGYRLVGKNPELSSEEFLSSLGEAKLQLHAIDRALEELDFMSLKSNYVMPPPPPTVHETAFERQELR